MGRILDWFFRDRTTGAVVIGQRPNLPLWLFVIAAGLGWVLEAAVPGRPPWIAESLRLASWLALAWRALDEVFRGANPWRRCLGGTVFIVLLAGSAIRVSNV